MYPRFNVYNRVKTDDLQSLEYLDSNDYDLEEFSLNLNSLLGHTINGIQPTVNTHAPVIDASLAKQVNAQDCESPGIFILNEPKNPLDHAELKPSITELHPSWFVSGAQGVIRNGSSLMTKDGNRARHLDWSPLVSVKNEEPDQHSPCQTVPHASFANIPSPVNSVSTYSSNDYDSAPGSPRSRHSSFSLPQSLSEVSKPYLDIPRQKPGRKPTGKTNTNARKRHVEKGTAEYVDKRCRNNIAVRKSREKAKQKQLSTESRVQNLTDENNKLQKRVELLSKELSVLRGLFVNVGAKVPANLQELIQKA